MRKRNVVVMLILVALCFVGYLFLTRQDTSGNGEPGALPPFWPKLQKSDVSAVTLRGQGDELKLRRREASTDRWEVIEGTELVRADNNAVDDLVSALAKQAVGQRYKQDTVTAANLASYGLDKPTIELELTVSGKSTPVRYGRLSREGSKVYADGGPGTDVFVVSKDAMDLAIAAVASRLHDKRLFDSTIFDVAKLEVVKGGVTTSLITRDLQQIWHVEQPFKGYANPSKVEAVVSRIVNVEVAKWEEFGAPDLEKYGLASPRAEVRVTPKGEGKKTETLLVGNSDAGGGYVAEAGTKSVARVGRSFFDALERDTPETFRDDSFTRLGNAAVVAIDVQLEGAHYKLEKAASQWDVLVGSDPRRPADGERVEKLLARLRDWRTFEFLDKTNPAEMGVAGAQFIEVTRETIGSGDAPKFALLVGNRGPDKTSIYAQRKDDGGLERVDAGPVDELLRGPPQYFRTDAADWSAVRIESLERDSGVEGEGQSVEVMRVQRDLATTDKIWKWGMTGKTGPIDSDALNGIVATVDKLRAVEWIPYAQEKDGERMGFRPPKAATMTLAVRLQGQDETDPDHKLYVGKRRPEGGYYAWLGDKKKPWAFVLTDEDVKTLMKPLEAPPPK